MLLRVALMLTICLSTFGGAYAAPGKPDNETAEFSQLFTQWKQLVGKLYQLRKRYQQDNTADKQQLEVEYKAIVKQATELSEPLSEAAEKAYLKAPNQDPELADFMMKTLASLVVGDDYDKGARWARMLLDNKHEHKDLNTLAGMAFFAVADFDNAEKCLQAANDAGTISANGRRYLGLIPKYKEMWAKEQGIRRSEEAANNLPKIKLETTKGDIVVVLFENEAPIATANFIDLVEKKFYDGLTFHRVLAGFMAQGGDPLGDGSGGPGYTIPDEYRQANHRKHFRGSLSMAKTPEPDSGGSQFFLTFVPTPHLDGKHTVFGRVIEGMDVLAKLERIAPDSNAQPDKIVRATVLSKRPHKYEVLGKRLDTRK